MPTPNPRPHAIRRLLAHRSLLPMILASLLAVALLAGRLFYSGQITYVFMPWNLFLAWIPYVAALWAGRLHCRYPGRWPYLLLPGGVWLAFFPNAPYIVTDFFHLQARPPVPLWYDVGLLSAFALAGLFLAVFSLHTMQRLVRHYAGAAMSWLFVAIMLGLGGLGVYLGRFLRWNSWDLVLNPHGVLGDLLGSLANPLGNPRTYGVTLLFAALLFVCYLAIRPREPAG